MYGAACKYRNDLRMRKPGKYWKERACIHLDEVLNYYTTLLLTAVIPCPVSTESAEYGLRLYLWCFNGH